MMTGYIFEHEGKQYDPDGQVSVADAAEHNRQLEAAELAYWQTKPDRMVAYVVSSHDGLNHMGKLTTWRGTTIGYVIASSTRTNNLTGTKLRHVRICGTNGAAYYGKYGSDWSQAVRLRKTIK